MEKYGLIGHPIADSQSPKLFAAAYGGTLRYDLIQGADFEKSYGTFLSEYKAVNVTAPFKELAFAQAVALAKDGRGGISGPCLKTGATNLMVKTPEGMMAYNTDFTGIILSVAEALFPGVVRECYRQFGERGHIKVHQFVRENLQEIYPLKPQALIVGCGGAGKAAAVAAAEMGFSVVLMNRAEQRAREIAAALPEYQFIVDPITDFREAFRECDLVIYTLPVALPEVADLQPSTTPSSGPKLILEANYKTPCLAGLLPDVTPGTLAPSSATVASGPLRYIPGINWLLYQALTGYGLMTGRTPDFAAMQDSITAR